MAGDPNWASVSVLLQGRGTNGSAVITDTGPSPKTVTPTNVTISTAQSKFNGSSIYFNGTTAYASIPYSSAFVIGSGACTIGCWIYITAYPVSNADIAVTNTATRNGYGLRLSSTGTIQFIASSTGIDSFAASSTAVLSLNTWHYVEANRSVSGLMKVFVNGVAGATTATVATQYDTTGPLVLGRNPTNSSWYYSGYVEGLFVVKGVAEHSANFSVPTRARSDGLGEVEGVVRDDAGAPCARTVRLIRRDTGAQVISGVSDATTGAYRLATPTLDEVSRIVHDDAAGTLYNDLIARVIPA